MNVWTKAFAVGVAGSLSLSASAQFFTDGIDDLSNWTPAAQADTTTAVVDYSALGIPEAPNMVAGSAATTGVQFTANTLGAGQAANLIGAVSGGNADLSLTNYQVQFDVWINTSVIANNAGNSTEQAVFGVGRTDTDALGRNNRFAEGDGVWGWLAGDNGYGTEDTAIFSGTSEQADLGDTNDPGADIRYNNTFNFDNLPTTNAAPEGEWVTITMTAINGGVKFWYNDVFFLAGSGNTDGAVMVGYEDPFGSIGADPANQFAIIDNVIIDDQITVPEPATAALLGLGGLAMLRRRSA